MSKFTPQNPPFDVSTAEMALYGEPQHESTVDDTDLAFYGEPQHESEVQDPDWLIAVARRTFRLDLTKPKRQPRLAAIPR